MGKARGMKSLISRYLVHYLTLIILFSQNPFLDQLVLYLFFILCSSLYICVSIYFLILFLSHPVVKDCRTEVRGKVFSHSLTASKVN